MTYSVGTITLTNGSRVVTGAGTKFVANVLPGFLLIPVGGSAAVIAEVNSDTQLTLARPWVAATLNGTGYDIVETAGGDVDLSLRALAILNTFGAVRDTVGQGLFPDGSPSAPAGRFINDQDTGWRRVVENVLAIVAGGVDRLTVDSQGAAVTGNRLELSGGTASNVNYSTNIANWSAGVADGSNRWRVSENQFGSEMLTISAGGTVGIGSASPQARLHVLGNNTTFRLESANAGATDTQIAIVTPNRQWNIGQNVGGSGVGNLNFFDVSAGGNRLTIDMNGVVRPGNDNGQSLGASTFRWSVIYCGTGSINTSDKREKKDIGDIPAEWLDAWGDVQWQRFRFRDAVKAKGEEARWHLGLIAQQVQEAFAARGLDAREIGLLCHDEWEATPAVKEVLNENGEIVTHAQPARKAGDRWGLRYDECQAIEAAWQRRRIGELEAAVAALAAQHG